MGAASALALLYPSQCVGCGELVGSDNGLCGTCWRDTPFIDGAVCDACGVPLIGGDPDDRDHCDECRARERPWQQGRAALVFSKRAKRLVMGLKYAGREDVVVPAAQWMARAGREILRPDSLLVPVPLHWLRLVRRRYNQAALLAKALSDETGCEAVLDALRRTAWTPKLKDMSPAERFQALSGTIRPKQPDRLKRRNVVLIDDVLTTGATLSAATEAVMNAGAARVDVLTLARTERYA